MHRNRSRKLCRRPKINNSSAGTSGVRYRTRAQGMAMQRAQWRSARQDPRPHETFRRPRRRCADVTGTRHAARYPDLIARYGMGDGGIRDALDVSRKLFEEWRYPYEHPSLFAETGTLKTAFTHIVDTYWKSVPPNEPLPSTNGTVGLGSRN